MIAFRSIQVTAIIWGYRQALPQPVAHRAAAAAAIDGTVKCLSHRNWFFTTVSGACETFMPPVVTRSSRSSQYI
jgi:hypothetical protein